MQISLNWLGKYINILNYAPNDLSKVLTDLGLEVETIESINPLKGSIVCGEVIDTSSHPDADKLTVCQVKTDRDEILQIVCGAKNVRKNLKVAVAKIGSVLPENFKIKKGKIRGIDSFGMLCSGKELGVSDEDEGILELKTDTTIGTELSEIYPIKDTVFTIGLTPNRSDCLSYIGIARDLAAKLNISLSIPKVSKNFGSKYVQTEGKINIGIQNNSDCGRFCALYIEDITVTASPTWLRKSLENSGMRPVNLIVDITNFVMLEFGQPIHAYDERDVSGLYLEVRKAELNESVTTIDSQKRVLTDDDIVISDREKIIGIAGIMGGANSEVKPDTKNIVIEVAHFNPSLVRKTAKKLALHSEASHRFERGIDIGNLDQVISRVGQLLYQVSEELIKDGKDIPLPKIAGDVLDHYYKPHITGKVAVRISRARKILGQSLLSQEECVGALQALGFKYLDKTDDRILVEVPSFRQDIEREIDLIEEIGRVKGYENIPYTIPIMEILPQHESPHIGFFRKCSQSLAFLGLNEAILFPFISEQDLSSFNISKENLFSSNIKLKNPISEEQSLLSTILGINLLKTAIQNHNHGLSGVRLFEIARTYFDSEKLQNQQVPNSLEYLKNHGFHLSESAKRDKRPIERTMVSGVLFQPKAIKSWQKTKEEYFDFFDGKEIVERFLNSFGIKDTDYISLEEDSYASYYSWLHPKKSAVLKYQNQILGYLGEVHPKTAHTLDCSIDHLPVLFELDLENIFKATNLKKKFDSYTQKFPEVTRDLSLLVPKSLTYLKLKKCVSEFKNRKNLNRFELFDVYQGENIPKDQKSIAINFSFKSDKKTLSDKEVDKEIKLLLNWLTESISAELR